MLINNIYMLTNKSSCVTLQQDHQNITSPNIFPPPFKFWQQIPFEFLSETLAKSPPDPQDCLLYGAVPVRPTSTFGGVGRSSFGDLLTRLGQGPVPYPQCSQHSSSSRDAEGTLHSLAASAWATPHTEEVTVPCKQPCTPADDHIPAYRKAAAEKILCRYGREWAHHYWIKCIYFCQHLYDSWIAYFFTVGKKCSISEDCLCPLTRAQHLEYSRFRNPPVFPELKGQSFYWCEVDCREEKSRRKMQTHAWLSTG